MIKDRVNDVMISIQPHWCNKIVSGEKTVEIRKTAPQGFGTFKVYVYATRPKKTLLEIIRDGDENYGEVYHGKPVFLTTNKGYIGSMWGRFQKVIGEFTCDAVEDLGNLFEGEPTYHLPYNGECCLTEKELEKYGKGKRLYGWHISNFVFYKEPRELAEFGLKRPPQSWVYVRRDEE